MRSVWTTAVFRYPNFPSWRVLQGSYINTGRYRLCPSQKWIDEALLQYHLHGPVFGTSDSDLVVMVG